jgi:hypothetical protein
VRHVPGGRSDGADRAETRADHATGRIELGLTANSSFKRPGLRREGPWASS